MKMYKRIPLGILNLILGCATLFYFITFLLSNRPVDRLEIAFTEGWPAIIAIILAWISGVLTLMGKHWVWSIVGISAMLVFWVFFVIATWFYLSSL